MEESKMCVIIPHTSEMSAFSSDRQVVLSWACLPVGLISTVLLPSTPVVKYVSPFPPLWMV